MVAWVGLTFPVSPSLTFFFSLHLSIASLYSCFASWPRTTSGQKTAHEQNTEVWDFRFPHAVLSSPKKGTALQAMKTRAVDLLRHMCPEIPGRLIWMVPVNKPALLAVKPHRNSACARAVRRHLLQNLLSESGLAIKKSCSLERSPIASSQVESRDFPALSDATTCVNTFQCPDNRHNPPAPRVTRRCWKRSSR